MSLLKVMCSVLVCTVVPAVPMYADAARRSISPTEYEQAVQQLAKKYPDSPVTSVLESALTRPRAFLQALYERHIDYEGEVASYQHYREAINCALSSHWDECKKHLQEADVPCKTQIGTTVEPKIADLIVINAIANKESGELAASLSDAQRLYQVYRPWQASSNGSEILCDQKNLARAGKDLFWSPTNLNKNDAGLK